MQKVVYIGANGMLGKDFADAASERGVEMVGLDLPVIDITQYETVAQAIPECDAVVNGAAYTRVDDAEKEIELARRINADGAGNVAKVCATRGIRFIQISTDYVFNGRKGAPYVESDATDPISMYGMTKWQGEVLVREACPDAVIARTQSLYGVNGKNFVKAILGQVIKGRKELSVVSDQVSSPTYTRHAAEAMLDLAGCRESGIVHVASRGECSWHAFAVAIIELLGIRGISVKPMPASDLNYPAPRPAYSVLSTERLTEWTGRIMPKWEDGLKAYLRQEALVDDAVSAGS